MPSVFFSANPIANSLPITDISRETVADKDVLLAAEPDQIADLIVTLKSYGADRVVPVNPASPSFECDLESAISTLNSSSPVAEIVPSQSLIKAARACRTPFPVEALGDYADMIQSVARLAAAPEAFVASTLLACVSGLITGRYTVEVRPGFTVAPILWFANVGDASCSKSVAQDMVIRPLREIEFRKHREYEEALNESDDPKSVPTPPRVCVNNTSLEALQHLAAEQGRGLLSVHDELSDWFSSLKRYNRSSQGDKGAWLSAHNGQRLSIDRRNLKKPIFVPCWGVALVGAIPPSVLSELSRDAELDNQDGLDVRLCYLRPTLPPVELRPEPSDYLGMGKLEAIWQHLFDLREMVCDPEMIRFSTEARSAFETWRVKLLEKARGQSSEVAPWTGKLPGLVARLSGVLAALDAASQKQPPSEISLDVYNRALKIADVLTAHRRKIELERGSPTVERLAAELGAFVLDHNVREIDTFEIRRGVVPGIRSTAILKSVLLELQAGGWLKSHISPRRDDPLPRVVSINPRVFDDLRANH